MIHESHQLSDEDLVRDALSGDEEAFGGLFERYYDMVYAFAYKLCLNAHDAEDIAQDTFVRAARSLHSLRNGFFKAWIYRIATNLAHDMFRRQSRQKTECLDPETAAVEMKPPSDSVDVLEKLPFVLRQTVVLVYLEGLNHAEAAQALGCAETTVSWRIFRAKRKLKQLLGKEEWI
jgi:RNA polymerase sigma-70 factor, ECF subfamily